MFQIYKRTFSLFHKRRADLIRVTLLLMKPEQYQRPAANRSLDSEDTTSTHTQKLTEVKILRSLFSHWMNRSDEKY